MDANRDFPYLQHEKMCMRTIAGRVANELFREHLFQLMITFHGGTEVIGYEWGSRNHLLPHSQKSSNPPDAAGILGVATAMQLAAGKSNGQRGYRQVDGRVQDTKWAGPWYYPIGTMTNTVYYVDGGMEDWSYGGSWENPIAKAHGKTEPINTCKPTTYGGYPVERTVYNEHQLRLIDFLVETTDDKKPAQSTLGSAEQLLISGMNDGHIPRNMRMCLKLIELLEPEVYFESESSFRLVGCVSAQVDLVRVGGIACGNVYERLTKNETIISSLGTKKCAGLGLWEGIPEESPNEIITFDFTDAYSPTSGDCVAIRALFDQDWAQQDHPDPDVKPQTHLVRARTVDGYVAENGGRRIEGHKTRYFEIPRRGAAKPEVVPPKPIAIVTEPEREPEREPEPKPESKPEREPEPEPKPAAHAEDLTKKPDTTMVEPHPMLRSDRVFYLWLMVILFLVICVFSQSRKVCYPGDGFKPLTNEREVELGNGRRERDPNHPGLHDV